MLSTCVFEGGRPLGNILNSVVKADGRKVEHAPELFDSESKIVFSCKNGFFKPFSFCCVDDVDSKGVRCLLSPLWWQEVNWTDTNRFSSQVSVNTTPADPRTKMQTQVDSSFSAARCSCLLMLSLHAALTAPKKCGRPSNSPRAALNTSHVIPVTCST